jgi:hypothetical protein
MTFWWLLGLLVGVAAAVAYVGDWVARQVGRRHWRLLGLRPRATASLIAVLTGVIISLGAYASFFLLVRSARETLLQAEVVLRQRDRLAQEVHLLQGQLAQLRSGAARELAQRIELSAQRDALEKALQGARLELIRLHQGLQASRAERSRLQRELVALGKAYAEERAALQRARLEQAELVRTHQALARSLREARAQLSALNLRSAHLQAQLAALNHRLIAAQLAQRAAQKRFALLQAQTDQLYQEKSSLESSLALLTLEDQNFTSEQSSLAAQAAQLSVTLGLDQQAIQQLNLRVVSLESEINRLRESQDLLRHSLSLLLNGKLLLSQVLQPGIDPSQAERSVNLQAELLGFPGARLVAPVPPDPPAGGLLRAYVVGIDSGDHLLVRVTVEPHKEIFPRGTVLARTTILLPATVQQLAQSFERLRSRANQRLLQAGWIPEELLLTHLDAQSLFQIVSSLDRGTGGAEIAIVAQSNLYLNDPPNLEFAILR